MAKKNKLTDAEYSAVQNYIEALKMDEIFCLAEMPGGKGDCFADLENEEDLPLEEGFAELWEAVAYHPAHDVSEEEAEIIMELFVRFGAAEDLSVFDDMEM